MKKIILGFSILLIATGCNNVGINQNQQQINNTNKPATFNKAGDLYSGSLTLTGYLKVRKLIGMDGAVDYADFVIINTDAAAINSFLDEYKGNSFIGNNAIGLGCYEQTRIYSNQNNSGSYENSISGNDFNKLVQSSVQRPIQLTLTKAVSRDQGAPNCTSLFNSFKIR